ncbi:integral membrane [Trichoderma arundinaceum]|uniref:Integral membrane n=1 Tax=Trichoderma arundinaceum TaxID=490622 RepID=A0A395NF22_TRIAR|nr:integral membrane [Trichoderma arundinaceum]
MALASNVVSEGGFHDEQTHIVMYVFFSLALYNVGELVCHIAVTFKRFRGLYCWSFLVATFGIALNAVGFLLRSMKASLSTYIYTTLGIVGWAAMITGQSLVVYSRLHIVLPRERLIRGILIMIVVNSVWLLVPMTVLIFLCNSPDGGRYQIPYFIFDKIQLTVFFLQEVVISALYIHETYKILRSYRGLVTGANRATMVHLILINLVIIALDVSVLILQYTNHYDLQTAWKPFVYSIKLKMEFSVLNRLVELSQYMRRNRGLALIDTSTASPAALPLGAVNTDDGSIIARRRSTQDESNFSTVTSTIGPKAKPIQPEASVSVSRLGV